MDTTKYKSVATKMETYNKAKIIASHSHRSNRSSDLNVSRSRMAKAKAHN